MNMRKKVSCLLAATLICTSLFSTVAYAETIEPEYESIVHYDSDTGTYEEIQVSTELPAGDSGISPGYMGDAPMPMQPFSIVDPPDNRYTVQNPDQVPYRYIGIMSGLFADGTQTNGTAFLVSEDVILPSAELVYMNGKGMAEYILFQPGVNNKTMGENAPYGMVQADREDIYISTNFKNDVDDNKPTKIEHRYAVIKLNTAIGRQTGYFGIEAMSSATNAYQGVNVTVAGYTEDYELRKQPGDITYSYGGEIRYRIDTKKNQLGAPVYETTPLPNGYYVRGINVLEADEIGSTYNAGRTITAALYNVIKSRM